MKDFKKVIEELTKRNETISTMESCTGGGVANAITNIEGASNVLKFSAVTYSNEYKIKMGVNKNIIDEYSVYSIETAHEMAYNISEFAKSNYGIGITGKINRSDKNNNYGADNEIFISIYHNNKYHDIKLIAKNTSRKENKDYIIDNIIKELEMIICEEDK